MAPPRHYYEEKNGKPVSHKVKAIQVANKPVTEAEADSFLTISLKWDTSSKETIFPDKNAAKLSIRAIIENCHDGCLTELNVLNPGQCWIRWNFNRINVSVFGLTF